MVKRAKEKQEIHDIVVSKVKSWLETNNKGCEVITNPSQEKNQHVIRGEDKVYPDVVYRPKSGELITRLYEVETEESVNEDEAKQWKLYNSGKSSFYLVIPKNKLVNAKKLVSDANFTIDGYHIFDEKLNIS